MLNIVTIVIGFKATMEMLSLLPWVLWHVQYRRLGVSPNWESSMAPACVIVSLALWSLIMLFNSGPTVVVGLWLCFVKVSWVLRNIL